MQEVDTINTVDGYSPQATDVKENGNLAHRPLSADIEPLWSPKLILKLFYPLPFIMAFGFVMKFIGSL